MIVIIQHTVKIINPDGKLAFRTDLLFSRDGQDAEHLWLSYAPDALHPEHRGAEYYNAASITKKSPQGYNCASLWGFSVSVTGFSNRAKPLVILDKCLPACIAETIGTFISLGCYDQAVDGPEIVIADVICRTSFLDLHRNGLWFPVGDLF